MADPNIAIGTGDVRFEDRSGCLVLVHPVRGDLGAAWPADRPGSWRWRTAGGRRDGTPYPTGTREQALDGLLAEWKAEDPSAERMLDAQRGRMSFGYPQIVKS